MEYKYEPVFGDQSLFDGAPEDAEAVAGCKPHQDALVFYKFSDGEFQYKYEAEIDGWKVSTCKHPQSVIKAMRRIIPEPKRWTMEDKMAGRLPEVGAKYVAGVNDIELTLLFIEPNKIMHGYDKNNSVYAFQDKYCHPIETPEEKAQRERREWGEKASAVFINSSSNQFTSIYDALLSGELPMPKKEDE